MENTPVKVETRQTNRIEFASDQIKLIKATIAKDATDDELKMFMYQCQTTGLNPLARQIYFMKRGSKNGDAKVSIQVSIDGFRVIAERSGTYAGQDEPEFVEENGKLVCAKVKAYKWSPGGNRYQAAVGIAYWDEYCPVAGQDFMWRKMPHTMLSKVAEALALRKAFPQDLSGLYTLEEMQQSDMKVDGPADQWQIDAIEYKMELAKLPDKQLTDLRSRIIRGMKESEAQKALTWLDQFIEPVVKGQKEIVNEIRKKVDAEEEATA